MDDSPTSSQQDTHNSELQYDFTKANVKDYPVSYLLTDLGNRLLLLTPIMD